MEDWERIAVDEFFRDQFEEASSTGDPDLSVESA